MLQVKFDMILELLSRAFGKIHDHVIQRTQPDTALRVHVTAISIHMVTWLCGIDKVVGIISQKHIKT